MKKNRTSEKHIIKEKATSHIREVASLIDEFNSNITNGLTASSVLSNMQKFGKNELSAPKRKLLIAKIGSSLLEPMMMILLFALTITLAVNIIRVTRGERFDIAESIGIFVAIFLSVSISIFMERKSEKAFYALKKMGENVLVKVLRNGHITQILQNELVVGDIIKFGVGDKITVDCRLVSSDDLQVDESSLTGESLPVKKNANEKFSANSTIALAERKNMIYAGTFVASGSCMAICTAVGDSTELGAIAKELKTVKQQETPLQQKLNVLGKIVAIFGACAAAVVFVAQLFNLIAIGGVSFEAVQNVFITSIVLIVAAVPEGLPTIVALSLALNVIKMSRKKVLVKKPSACETIGGVSVICSDKTGTLTMNKMTVVEFESSDLVVQKNLSKFMVDNICINSSADLDENHNGFIGNPTECALLQYYEKTRVFDTIARPYSNIRGGARIEKIFGFSSDLKRMTTVVSGNSSGKNLVLTKGAPEVIIKLSTIDALKKASILQKIAYYQEKAMRVLAFAHGFVDKSFDKNNRDSVEKNLIFDGFMVITDPVRPDVEQAVLDCQKAGIKVVMLTGDHLSTATAIAKDLSIIKNKNDGVYEAWQLESLTDEKLKKIVGKIKVVARSTPSIKLRVVNALQDVGETVAVTGDGVNDAPAIKSSSVGVAMGIAGTQVTKEAADIVVLDDSFSSIVTSVKFGRGIYENFQRFMAFQLTVNLSAVLVTVACILLGVGAPFTTLQLLWINLIMDGPPALTLGLEPIHKGLMLKSPVRRSDGIITKPMMIRIVTNGVFIATTIILQATTNFMGIATHQERTFLFATFMMMQLFNSFNARELGRNTIFKSLFRNKIMLITIALTIGLQVIITQFGGAMFSTVALSGMDWLKVFVMGISVIVFNEIVKFVARVVSKKRESRKVYASV